MTTLPYYPDINTAKKKTFGEEEKIQEYMHNWLYSVVPVSEKLEEFDNRIAGVTANGNAEFTWAKETYFPLGAYLVGYCKNCRRAFSQAVPCDADKYVETQLNIPVYGCVGPS